jgi:diguanylate cyclase (GGDEF)-like protein
VSALSFRIVQSAPTTTRPNHTKEERLQAQIDNQDAELSRLRHATLQDTTTGGANMRCLGMAYDWLEDGDPVSMLMVDIDGFRKVNDALGRHCGDALLTAIHTAIERELRWDDVVARESADRFAVLLPLAIEEDAHAVGERLRMAVERMCFNSELGRFRVTVRIGCSTQNGKEELNPVMGRADIGCRNARRQGGNMVFAV